MELEHVLHQSGWYLILQLLLGSLMVPAMIERPDLYRSFAKHSASQVVTFGPFGLLVYMLYEISKLS